MNDQPQEYPKWITAPEGWTPGGKIPREFQSVNGKVVSVVVQDEADEEVLKSEASK